ncbi:cysteine desulfurase family protein [Flavobacterium aciduliphilum]|uniref:cysteine desulfurase n=1 Tax=Flavobacterium aciduliphilum TaxID=1101402 RepID=A0A328YLK6_9FLAO|nr:cysteine desulfurase family protein [Flavobacterium aciduliphilum]RAR73705.1 cysteine desulfurase IscS [Flavobacterium aciduliphilum]
MNKLPIYLDAASTTPVDKRVLDNMLPYFSEIFGNASSNHVYGLNAKKAIDIARSQVAKLINADEKEIIFTSGATESINFAIKGFVESNYEKGNHIITVKTEHKAVLATCEYLETKGFEVTYLDVNENGLISLDSLKAAIKETTILIAIMYVNNEIGIIQPIADIGKIAQEQNICFFCDATQAVGKVKVDVVADNIDMLCFSGHKLNGPKGIGVLYKKKHIALTPLLHGGGQEYGLRAGTYNTPLIVGLGKACEIIYEEWDSNILKLLEKRNEIEKYYEQNNIGIINFKEVKTAPHILCITLNNYDAEDYLIDNLKQFVASTGSACNSGLVRISHVIESINNLNNQTFRISI